MAGEGVETCPALCLHSTPIPACLADRAEPEARLGGRRVGSTGPKHVRPPPQPGGRGNSRRPTPHQRAALVVRTYGRIAGLLDCSAAELVDSLTIRLFLIKLQAF